MVPIYETIALATDTFCGEKLNDDYRDLAREMIAALARKRPSPLASGQPRVWACGVMYLLARINFLSDRASNPYMSMADLRAAFGVAEGTASGKAKVISKALRADRMNPTWMLPGIAASNPMIWMAQVNGMIVDLRDMPREAQEVAYEKGLIPFIPADRGIGNPDKYSFITITRPEPDSS
jgi:hypothetical protein